MWSSKAVRDTFLDFFRERGHVIVPSAPIVNREDPELMFTNAGMNQFKDIFLGVRPPEHPRVANTQRCLRVSGKHNDLEEVGYDGYHHTMFEMLGNWSFGDYFKEEAIAWAWELITEVYGLNRDRLYVTVFEGDDDEGLNRDEEAAAVWGKYVETDRILFFGKADNFWEMGKSGPCGPCSEIHIDLRSEEERKRVDARTLVNTGHPEVIELWNLVFIQYNRKADGTLEPLSAYHVDTGMGFERLCMVLQGKKSSYETDIFRPIIAAIEDKTGKQYSSNYRGDAYRDIAFRVVADHVRAVAFAIADGQLPSNTGAGYVIRRILRRAVRYYYSYLDRKEPLLCELIPILVSYYEDVFPILAKQGALVQKIVEEEERAFLRTIASGLRRFEQLSAGKDVLAGEEVFELYDTYGFPYDLTELLARERGMRVDAEGFRKALERQRSRSRASSEVATSDWVVLAEGTDTVFTGYDSMEEENVRLLRYREIREKGKNFFEWVFDRTPFYAEGGGQVGDRGWIYFGDERIGVIDTYKMHALHIHRTQKAPADLSSSIKLVVDVERRRDTMRHHSATHLLHAALRQVLGAHVEQKGSLVAPKYLRFDFSHYEKMRPEQIEAVEALVNQKIMENIPLEEQRDIPIEEAKRAGAMMLFGEKYGKRVRMITFDSEFSRELCGGTHVARTGDIGWFVITSESGIAAGVRRIEARAGRHAYEYIRSERRQLRELRTLLKAADNVVKPVEQLQIRLKELEKDNERRKRERLQQIRDQLLQGAESMDGYRLVVAELKDMDAAGAKDLVYQLEQSLRPAVVIVGYVSKGKPQLAIRVSESLAAEEEFDARKIAATLAAEIGGGGGGQPFFATAGGKKTEGLPIALQKAKALFQSIKTQQ